MAIITELSHLFGIENDPNGENNDCTDFPTRPCKLCGKMDRPQWRGECNYDCDPLGILKEAKHDGSG